MWVDILENTLYRWDTTSPQPIPTIFPENIGCFGLTTKNNIIAGVRDGIGLFTPSNGNFSYISKPDAQFPDNRFNDGKCTPDGRFIAGTMDMNENAPNGSVYLVDLDQTTKKMISNVTISNGIAWNPDATKMYWIDTPTRTVKVFDYNSMNGSLSNPADFIKVPASLGFPDGMTADKDGRLYICHWGGHCLSIWDGAEGGLLETIDISALNPTSCTFGGPDLNDLYVTSARVGMSPAELQKYPLSGGIFKISTNAEGYKNFKFIEC
jgi:sugar lactone lactonase YvrE